MTNDFDFGKFGGLLYEASKAAFLDVQQAHTDERFYLFALFTCGDLGYVVPTASTEEGLTQVAQEYAKKERYQEFSLQQLREDLRWSPADSPLHLDGEEHFHAVNKLAEHIPSILYEIPTDDSWDEFNTFCDKVLGVYVEVLKQLDAEGIFGVGEQRDSVLLNILMGDQGSDEWLRYAKLLNPEAVYRHFEKKYRAWLLEMNRRYQAWLLEQEWSKGKSEG
jgi:hypothetical protein